MFFHRAGVESEAPNRDKNIHQIEQPGNALSGNIIVNKLVHCGSRNRFELILITSFALIHTNRLGWNAPTPVHAAKLT